MDQAHHLRSEIEEIRSLLGSIRDPDRELMHSMRYLRLFLASKQRRLAAIEAAALHKSHGAATSKQADTCCGHACRS